MELDRNEFDDLFEENENEDTAGGSVNQGTTEEGSGRTKVPVPKRIIKNPRLKFNPERLCGERGIPILVDHFKDVKFKGKGHEEEDLDKLLSTLELWTHRLFPSMKFEDSLIQIEKLGKKRPVQTCLRKIRLDMPILSGDFVKDDDDEEDNVRRNDDPEPLPEDSEPLPEDPFDRLIGESQDILNSNVSVTENFDNTNSMLSSPMPSSSQGQVLGSSFGSSLTEEQKERMEHNRLLAAERRKAKLEAMNTSNSQSADHETYFQNISDSNSSIQKSDLSIIVQNNKPESEENTLVMDTDHFSSEKEKVSAMELDSQNSEHVGLDDLIDLVDEGESSKKSTEVSPESEENTLVMDTNHFNSEKEKISAMELEDQNSELVGLDDLVDLVDEGESSKKSTEVSPGGEGNHSNDINDENIVSEKDRSFENISKVSIPVTSTDENTDINKSDVIKPSDSLENAQSELLGLESMLDLVEE